MKKGKKDSNVLFIDATNECIKVTNNNKLTKDNINTIIDWYEKRETVDYKTYCATYDEVVAQDYNLAINTYVETEKINEIIDVKLLNEEIREVVAEEERLRKEIENIISTIEV